MEPAGGKQTRAARSRAACAGCRATKQKCDGPSRIPCRRCELYGLACDYPPLLPAAKPAAARLGSSASTSALPPSSTLPPPPPFFTVNSNEGAVDDRLREIADRLRSIESSLSHMHLNPSAAQSSDSADPPDPLLIGGPYQDSSEAASSPSHRGGDDSISGVLPTSALPGHALQSVSATIDFIEALEKSNTSALQEWNELAEATTSPKSPGLETMLVGHSRPDAIDREILSIPEVEASFKIFFRMLAPWTFFFDLARDNQAMEVRERCPLLFHAILTSTSYYLMGTSERATKVYKALVALTNELFAPIVMSTQEYDLNSDLLRALCVLTLYKPVQFPSFHYSGRVDTAERAEQFAKLNTTSSFTLWGIIARVATRIGLPSMPNLFAKLYSPTAAPAPGVMADLRLWLWIILIDNHGALTTGRAPTLDVTDALRITRMFSALKHQVGDVRLASMVELYAISRQSVSKPWFSDFTKRAPAYDLRKVNRDLDDWEQYWTGPLEAAAMEGDALALHPINTIAQLVRAIINSSVFMRWQTERRASLAKGLNERPEMSSEDWASMQLVLNAVERQIYTLSVESRIEGSLQRRVLWATKAFDIPKGGRPPLTLDQSMVDMHRTAFDPIICVAFVYPLLLVARMCNSALVTCEMVVKDQNDYESGKLVIDRPQYLLSGAKFARLLDLGSRFLDAVAPTASHPAKRHARILRAMFVVGSVDVSQLLPNARRKSQASSTATSPPTAGASGPTAATFIPTSGSDTSSPPSINGLPRASYSSVSSPTSFNLPPVPDASASAESSTSATTPSEPGNEAGEMLRTILSGIDPTFFGEELTYGMGLVAPTEIDTSMNMAVDWTSLEKTLNSMDAAQQVPLPQMDYFTMLAREGQI